MSYFTSFIVFRKKSSIVFRASNRPAKSSMHHTYAQHRPAVDLLGTGSASLGMTRLG